MDAAAIARIEARLRHDDFEIEGRLPWSSNGTFLVRFGDSDDRAVYKPRAGERPLWDFPAGLHRREAAAHELSKALGWGVVPPTVVRDDAPLGPGSLQHFVDADFSEHHFTLVGDARHHDRLRQICVFDLLANNTDRKSGHCLLGRDGDIWAIDNGLCFAVPFKLRTVIWEFAGQPVPEALLSDVEPLTHRVPEPLAALLVGDEIGALVDRARTVVADRSFPVDPTGQRYPWPLV